MNQLPVIVNDYEKVSFVLSVSMVWHLKLLLKNSFNKNEAAIFPMQAMFPKDFPFFSD